MLQKKDLAVAAASLATLISTVGCSERGAPEPTQGSSLQEPSGPQLSNLARLGALNDVKMEDLSQGRPQYQQLAASLRQQLDKGELALDEYQSRILDSFLLSGGDIVVKFGEVSERVAIVHSLLVKSGDLSSSQVDGIFLEGTRKAIKEFQLSGVGRVTYDGEFSFRTVSALLAGADGPVFSNQERQRRHEGTKKLCQKIAYGSSVVRDDVEAVTELQNVLDELGFSLSVDGELGRETRGEVIEFQAQMGLMTDGVVGRKTLRYLLAQYYAASYEVNSE